MTHTQRSRPRTLRQAIRRLGLTQQQFADKIGITQGAVSRYVRGERVPSLALAVEIADAAGIPVRSLLGESRRPATADAKPAEVTR